MYAIYDQSVSKAVSLIGNYVQRGIAVQAATLEELAQKVGLEMAALKKTVAEYNEGLEKKSDKYGRTIFGEKVETGPFGCLKVKPGAIMTVGGLKVDEQVLVVKKNDEAIPGLYAAGEISGGYRAYGYIGGDLLAQCAISGMVGGKHAAAFALRK